MKQFLCYVCLLINCIKDEVVFNETRQKGLEFKDLQSKHKREDIGFKIKETAAIIKINNNFMVYAGEY
jgi:hypothetical protein